MRGVLDGKHPFRHLAEIVVMAFAAQLVVAETPTSAEPLDVLALKCNALADRERFTPREREIVLHLAQGRTVHAISEKLFVSENTVKSHIKSIYLKLDIHSRAELIEIITAEGE